MDSNWLQFKTAFLLDEKFNRLPKAITDGMIFKIFQDDNFPKGWEFIGTEIAGAAGFVLLFEIDHSPSNMEMDHVEMVIELAEARDYGL